MFKKNIGRNDRIIRFLIGLILLGIALYFRGTFLFFIFLIFSFFSFFESLFSWCAFYQLIGKNTCPIKAQ
ncbi:MAG: DUF2892 domain-containing protein [Patescibacteria group bacterium]